MSNPWQPITLNRPRFVAHHSRDGASIRCRPYLIPEAVEGLPSMSREWGCSYATGEQLCLGETTKRAPQHKKVIGFTTITKVVSPKGVERQRRSLLRRRGSLGFSVAARHNREETRQVGTDAGSYSAHPQVGLD